MTIVRQLAIILMISLFLFEIFGVFEDFSDVIEELGGVSTVCDSVIDADSHAHDFSDHDAAFEGYAGVSDLTYTHYAALAWHDDRDE